MHAAIADKKMAKAIKEEKRFIGAMYSAREKSTREKSKSFPRQ